MASGHATDHDYHIIPPSPWPFIGSIAALVMAIGAVVWFHGGAWLWFALGLLGVLYTMVMWWRDVIRESIAGDHTPVVSLHLRYGMILFIASEVMFFVAWFWAYFDAGFFPGPVEQPMRTELLGGVWPPQGIETFDPWHLPLMNTVILLTSGTTVTWAHHAMIHDDREGVKQGLALTIALGILFSAVQIYEYSHASFDFSGHIYGATFYMATGFHGFHVFVGTVFLAVCLFRVLQGQMNAKKHFGFEAAAWYWHFVDVVWLFLFVAIYVWGYGGGGH